MTLHNRSYKGVPAKAVVAVIPARGGSRGLPGKNVRDLCGMPLIAYSIEVAKRAGLVDRIVVSTDSQEIAEVARKWGAEVPFLRPPELAGGTALVGKAVQYTMDRLYGPEEDNVVKVIMLPTSPFRTPQMVDALVERVLDGCTWAYTARQVEPPRLGGFVTSPGKGFNLVPCGRDEQFFRVQPYGILSVTRTAFPHREFVHLLEHEASLVDIDMLEDFFLAESIVEKNLFDFGFSLPNKEEPCSL